MLGQRKTVLNAVKMDSVKKKMFGLTFIYNILISKLLSIELALAVRQ